MKNYFVYILASKKDGVLYTGVTSDIRKRIYEHKNKVSEGFTNKYWVKRLVYYEVFYDVENAIKREKNIKAWKRNWKIEIIEKKNPEWKDLYEEVV